jgi:single-stranded-DNA-specific exonuclease
LAPRINAPGRIDYATKSFELLVTENRKHAQELAIWLDQKNEKRQEEMETIVNQAIGDIEKNELSDQKIIILSGKWLKGIIGPSASRIVEMFYRPVILFAEEEDKYIGSARSIEGVNIIELFNKASKYIDRYGGHKGAAGLTVKKQKFAKFKSVITSYLNANLSAIDLLKKVKIDMVVSSGELSIKNIEKISEFEPFGLGNPKPLFLLSRARFSNIRKVGGNDQHLSAMIDCDGKKFKVIIFNFDQLKINIESEKEYDIVLSMILNEWNGTRDINLNILKIREYEIKK